MSTPSEYKLPEYTVKDYASFALAGAIGCGATHGAMTPIDVVKTRIQLEPTVYNKGMLVLSNKLSNLKVLVLF